MRPTTTGAAPLVEDKEKKASIIVVLGYDTKSRKV